MADLPQLPAPHKELARYISEHREKSIIEIMDPYRKFEANLRSVYAQDRQNPILNDPHLNVLPLFTEDTHLITTRARDLQTESDLEKSKYIMPLPEDKRRPHNSPATVANLAEFQKNFNVFSESSLVDVDWSNVVAAGSSVVNCLLPVPKEFNTTKRKLREYYHEKFCPASDVDLFLYGLTHDQAIEKIKQIEQAIRDALLNEVTVVRTKYALTIASQYPVRHIQIVLRVYKSVSEILTGFDIDAAGGAFDGKQVYVTPRALGSFITQINHIDLTRRSPSYENRLSKYSHRNFEVYWPDLDRLRVDPTIFERSFKRTLGLARLLVLERLPTTSARETYLNKRREERGRPTVFRNNMTLHGNIKDYHEDEIADWLSEEDISNYHTFTVPYGQHFNAKRIEKLCYTRDLLLNAEWNQSAERTVYLHRHPAFFGRVEDVIEDCCGSCPTAVTDEEIEIDEKEAEIYIKGPVTFLIDDPGRQQIGSFNPLTEQDWTDMAYIGNTARLCQSIVNGDIDDVLNWLSQEGADPNQRDWTGRSPLHLAVMTSTPDIVKCLVDHGSRLSARLADGKTALHLAASRGDRDIIKILMEKSIENEEAEEARQDRRRKAARAARKGKESGEKKGETADSDVEMADAESDGESEKSSDGEMIDAESTVADTASIVTGSFVKVKKGDEEEERGEGLVLEQENEDEPDYFQIDVLAWDVPCSPLHLAIAEGHEEAVKLLCDYGADSILPVKFLNSQSADTSAILTLTLALALPREKAKSMAQLLLNLGATSSQGDTNGCTAFHRYVESGKLDLIDTLWDNDKTGVKSAINHLVFGGNSWNPESIAPLHTAVALEDPILVLKLLEGGASADIDFETWLKAAKTSSAHSQTLGNLDDNKRKYQQSTEQPLVTAIRSGSTDVATKLLEHGADPNALPTDTQTMLLWGGYRRRNGGETALDMIRTSIKKLRGYRGEGKKPKKPIETPGKDAYLEKFTPGTYSHWVIANDIEWSRDGFKNRMKSYQRDLKNYENITGVPEKSEAIKEALQGFEALEKVIVERGGKTFEELHPDMKPEPQNTHSQHFRTEEKDAEGYEYIFSFRGDSEMTEKRRDGYIELMEASWSGDIEKIKALTLQAWGPEQDQQPLKMAIADDRSHTPFSFAFLRGHYEVAWTMLEIVKAQWSPADKEKVRFRMETHNDDDDECSDEDSDVNSDDNEPRIVSEKVDHKFTIDNIGQVSMQVKSRTKPLHVLQESVPTLKQEGGKTIKLGSKTLLIHVMEMDDNVGLKTFLDMAQHFAGQKFEGEDDEGDDGETSKKYVFPQQEFRWAIEHGKTQQLATIIKRTGAGIPLDHLIKKSGVEIKKKPRSYQGLTVYGKKRKDWANAGRNMVVRTTGLKTPPLLHAALEGSLESVEFFLGDAPHRLYADFGKSKAGREDSRLKHLMNSPGGFDRAISKWLGADNDLVMHCAVLARPCETSNELLEYLIQAAPDSLQKKNSDGDTPLLVAARLGRIDYVRILIKGNADQSARNHKGENILHAVVANSPKSHKLRLMLDLFDADLRSNLFLQRNNFNENGNTPLHAWVARASGVSPESTGGRHGRYRNYYTSATKPYGSEADVVGMLKLLLEYSKGEELEMLNGAGETCLHTAVMQNMLSIAQVLVKSQPKLLYRENAVGRTPAELAHDRLTEKRFSRPDKLSLDKRTNIVTLLNTTPGDFVAKNTLKNKSLEEKQELLAGVGLRGSYSDEEIPRIMGSMGAKEYQDNSLDTRTTKEVMWALCLTAMQSHPISRRLVSLNEANDVAKRLGEKYSASRYFSIQARGEDEDGEDQEETKEVSDFATRELTSRMGGAWSFLGDGKCPDCGRYH